MQKKRKEKGIAIIALVATISVLMIIFGVTIYTTRESFKIKDLTNLYSDIEMLEDRAKVYFTENGEFPVTNNSSTIDNKTVYKIDKTKINNINGLHNDIDKYYIDKTTGRVYLEGGVTYDGTTYYTKTEEQYQVDSLEIKAKIYARFVDFTPDDNEWNVQTVQQALDYLYNN